MSKVIMDKIKQIMNDTDKEWKSFVYDRVMEADELDIPIAEYLDSKPKYLVESIRLDARARMALEIYEEANKLGGNK